MSRYIAILAALLLCISSPVAVGQDSECMPVPGSLEGQGRWWDPSTCSFKEKDEAWRTEFEKQYWAKKEAQKIRSAIREANRPKIRDDREEIMREYAEPFKVKVQVFEGTNPDKWLSNYQVYRNQN